MKIITSYPVLLRNKVINRGPTEFSNITATSNKDSIKSFQTWYNKQSPKKPLKVDGAWGPKTSAAWDAKGMTYEKQMMESIGAAQSFGAGLFGAAAPSKIPENLTPSNPQGEQKPGMMWDSSKGDFISVKPESKATDLASTTLTRAAGAPTKNASKTPATSDNKEKPAGLSKTAKIAMGVGGLLIVIIIIAVAAKKKKK